MDLNVFEVNREILTDFFTGSCEGLYMYRYIHIYTHAHSPIYMNLPRGLTWFESPEEHIVETLMERQSLKAL